jgi:predicted peptidase
MAACASRAATRRKSLSPFARAPCGRAWRRFAAAMPVCGGGDIAQAKNNTQTGVWAFHGKADNVVPYENSVRMVNATKKVNTNVHLISFPDVKHDSWNKAFAEKKILRDFISTRKK